MCRATLFRYDREIRLSESEGTPWYLTSKLSLSLQLEIVPIKDSSSVTRAYDVLSRQTSCPDNVV